MEWEAWVVLATLAAALTILCCEAGPPDQVMFACLLLFWNLGIIPTSSAFAGFSNSAVITIGSLFVVARAVERSKLVDRATRGLLGKTGEGGARLRLCAMAMGLSAFMNNTPVVALLMPVVRDWARSRGLAASRFLIPLSYATIMGGLFTTIGSSTNLVINGLLVQVHAKPFSFFDPALVAVPVGLVGLLYLVLVAPLILPGDRGGLFRALREQKENMVTQLELTSECGLVGEFVFDALDELGIPHEALVKMFRVGSVDSSHRSLPRRCPQSEPDLTSRRVGARTKAPARSETTDGLSEPNSRDPLLQLWGGPEQQGPKERRRQMASIFPVPAHEKVQDGDVLVLSLGKDVLTRLVGQRPQGLKLQDLRPLDIAGSDSEFIEVMLAPESPLVGCAPSDASQLFMDHYRVALIALRSRSAPADPDAPDWYQTSEQIIRRSRSDSPKGAASPDSWSSLTKTSMQPPAGSPRMLAAGDVALLLVPSDVELSRADFLTVTRVAALPPPITTFDLLPVAFLVCGLALTVTEVASMERVAATLSAIFVLGGWVPSRELRQVVDWHLLILVGSALGVAQAVQASGLSGAIAAAVKAAGFPPVGALVLLFLTTMLITELVTNNAAAALGFALAVDLAKELDLESPRCYAMAVMMAASSSYACPLGYTTNLMVFASGDYSFGDFFRVGVWMDLIWWVGCSLLLPLAFPLE